MRDSRSAIRVFVVALLAMGLAAEERTCGAAEDPLFAQHFAPLLTQYCVDCHSGEKPKGDLRLDTLELDLVDAAARAQWSEVVERIQAGEMPPEGKPRPAESELKRLADWLSPRIASAEADARAIQGRV